QRLRRVPCDQKRLASLIDEISAVAALLQRVSRITCRCNAVSGIRRATPDQANGNEPANRCEREMAWQRPRKPSVHSGSCKQLGACGFAPSECDKPGGCSQADCQAGKTRLRSAVAADGKNSRVINGIDEPIGANESRRIGFSNARC